MGDLRRHHVFANFIAEHWPDRSLSIADVAGGTGHLNSALRQLGYNNVITFDKRSNQRSTNRRNFRFQLFSEKVKDNFDLVIGMHPDGGTDEAINWAINHRVPFAVVPCCVIPSAWNYWGERQYGAWLRHLSQQIVLRGIVPLETGLAIVGRNIVLANLESGVIPVKI
jgi:hypothetical protein